MDINVNDFTHSEIVLTEKTFHNVNHNKKRPSNPSTWKENKSKFLRTHGEPSLSKNGTLKPGKSAPAEVRQFLEIKLFVYNLHVTYHDYKLQKACWVRCNLDGCMLPADERSQIFKGFYSLNSTSTQRTYLLGLIERDAQEGFIEEYRWIKIDFNFCL
jgi:hypothetical protein